MADKIEVDSTFDGTVSFVGYGRLENAKQTPYIEFVCTDGESGKVAYGKMFCSEKALPYTVKKLKALGIEGGEGRDVVGNAGELLDTPCSFDTIDNDGFFNADNVRAQGTKAPGGGGGDSMDKTEFLDGVFGAGATTPSAASDDKGVKDPPF